jgi:NAD-dependent dihydropyrimidine dehydrogenase PreA subunit
MVGEFLQPMKHTTCQSCGKSFPHYLKIDGKWKKFAGRSYCLECSPRGGGNRRKLKNFTLIDGVEHKRCKSCELWQTLDQFHVHVGKRDQLVHASDCSKCKANKSKEAHHEFKQKAVAYKGGVCMDCKLVHPFYVYDFHHREPDKKDFEVSIAYRSYDWSAVYAELDKCDLLCANCHRTRHFKLSNYPTLV